MNNEVKKKFLKQLIDLDIPSQAELARRLSISPGYLCLILSRKRRPRDLQLTIARIVKIDPQELWQE